jgi:hypothetical protein
VGTAENAEDADDAKDADDMGAVTAACGFCCGGTGDASCSVHAERVRGHERGPMLVTFQAHEGDEVWCTKLGTGVAHKARVADVAPHQR